MFVEKALDEGHDIDNISWVLVVCKFTGRSPLTYLSLFNEYVEKVDELANKELLK